MVCGIDQKYNSQEILSIDNISVMPKIIISHINYMFEIKM